MSCESNFFFRTFILDIVSLRNLRTKGARERMWKQILMSVERPCLA